MSTTATPPPIHLFIPFISLLIISTTSPLPPHLLLQSFQLFSFFFFIIASAFLFHLNAFLRFFFFFFLGLFLFFSWFWVNVWLCFCRILLCVHWIKKFVFSILLVTCLIALYFFLVLFLVIVLVFYYLILGSRRSKSLTFDDFFAF